MRIILALFLMLVSAVSGFSQKKWSGNATKAEYKSQTETHPPDAVCKDNTLFYQRSVDGGIRDVCKNHGAVATFTSNQFLDIYGRTMSDDGSRAKSDEGRTGLNAFWQNPTVPKYEPLGKQIAPKAPIVTSLFFRRIHRAPHDSKTAINWKDVLVPWENPLPLK